MRDTKLLGPDTGAGGGESEGTTDPNPQSASVLERYRELMAAQPGLVPEMVRGNTVEDIDASAEEARRAYDDISRRIAQQFERAVSPGNPTRSSADIGVDSLKPEAKIALGLRRSER